MASSTNTAAKLPEEQLGIPDIISLPEACKFLGVHRNTIYKLIQEEDLPAFRMSRGGRWKFRRSELEEWLENKQSRGRL